MKDKPYCIGSKEGGGIYVTKITNNDYVTKNVITHKEERVQG
jgi:hypothetical protein